MACANFLAPLISDEVARREQKKFGTRMRRAQFRTSKMLEQFDLERLPQLSGRRPSTPGAACTRRARRWRPGQA